MPQLLEPSCSDISLEDLTAEYKPISNLRVIRNLVVLSVGCLMAFCSYDGLVMLQSTINQESGIGVISVAVQFSFSCITALLLPEYLFEKIGCKSVIVICLISFVPYIASNFYPHWSLMIPSSILLGLANSLYWAAESAYLNHLSILYSSNLKRNKIAASTKKCNKRSDEKIGDQEVNMNVQILNKCVSDCARVLTDINKELKETVVNNKSDLTEEAENHFYQGINAPRNTENSIKITSVPSAELMNAKSDAKSCELLSSTTARFFGIHGLIYQTCHVWGNLLSYYILRIGAVEEINANSTIGQCGADFCNIQTNCSTNNLREPEDDLRNLLVGVFVAISVLAVVFVLFGLDELKHRKKNVTISWEYMTATFRQIKDKRQLLLIPMSLNIGVMQGFVMGDFTKVFVLFGLDELKHRKKNVTISWEYMTATFRQIKDKRQLLLIPMSLNIGVMQGFVMGDFTKDYVACAWGVHHVGIVTACLGVTLSLAASISGCLVKYLGRRTVFLAAKVLNLAAVVVMYLWEPTSSETYMFFIISGMLGAVLATFWSQLRAFYGVLFQKKEGAAFANYQLWHAVGMAMTFAYSNFICTSTKICIYLAFSSFGMIGYLLAENLASSDT